MLLPRYIADADTLRRYNTRIDADFQVFAHHANLLAAEVAYAVLEPYQPLLLEGDSLEDITSPSNKVTAGDVPRFEEPSNAITVICEEMTTYADFISDKELLAKFVKVATTLSRKQEMPICFVTHNNTQSCMGEIKGLANLIGRMQQIQLLPTTDQNTSQPTTV